MLTRQLTSSSGTRHTIRIGILSILPQQTAAWNQNHLDGKAEVADPASALETAVPQLKDEGADLIIILAHTGIPVANSSADRQSRALEIAQIPGVDAVIAGHTHIRFPDAAQPQFDDVDPQRGALADKPAALPGFGGSDLAVMDLDLSPEQGWGVTAFSVSLERPYPGAAEDEEILGIAARAHQATRTYLSQPVGEIRALMHTFFAMADPSSVQALMAMAQKRAVEALVAGTELSNLPLLSAAASPASGGLSGPNHYICMPAGMIQRRHIAGLNPFANQIWAVRIKGHKVLQWLEKAAEVFHCLSPDAPEQNLINPDVPGQQCDCLFGLSYAIDPTRPPMSGTDRLQEHGETGRVKDVMWGDVPIHPEQDFLIATNHFRASGGGGFSDIVQNNIVLRSDLMLGEALTRYLEAPDCAEVRTARPWHFAPDLGVSAILETSPDALKYLSDIAPLRPEPCGTSADGFARVRLHL